MDERCPVPLNIHHVPIAITFGLFSDGEHVALDPSYLEEQVVKGSLTVGINEFNQVCAINKPGGVPIELEKVLAADVLYRRPILTDLS